MITLTMTKHSSNGNVDFESTVVAKMPQIPTNRFMQTTTQPPTRQDAEEQAAESWKE